MYRFATAAALAALSLNVSAIPVELNLTGTVTSGTGSRAGDVGSAVQAHLVIDLDPTNAALYEDHTSEVPPYSSWWFTQSQYVASFTGNWGTISGTSVWIETLDNFNADTFGNPFGVTGVVDVLSIFGSNDIVDCGEFPIHPITGCTRPDAPRVEGQEFGVNLVYDNDWFDGSIGTEASRLPTFIPELTDPKLVGIFGSGIFAEGGSVIGENEMTYAPLNVSQTPVPAAAWLFVSGLGFLGWMQRRHKSSE